VRVLARALASCSALTQLGLQQLDRALSAQAGPKAHALALAVAAPARLRHLSFSEVCRRGTAGWNPAWASLAQLTAVKPRCVVPSEARAAVLGIGQLTGLRCLRFGFEAVAKRDEHWPLVLWDDAVAAAMARAWPLALTRLTTLDLCNSKGKGLYCDMSSAAAALLSVRLAPLGRGLVCVRVPPHMQSEAPLKPLAIRGQQAGSRCRRSE
jgi:hypothetical protein